MCLLDLVPLLHPLGLAHPSLPLDLLVLEDLMDLLHPLGLALLLLLCHPLDLVVPAHLSLQLDLLVPEDLLDLSLPEDLPALLARFPEDLVDQLDLLDLAHLWLLAHLLLLEHRWHLLDLHSQLH